MKAVIIVNPFAHSGSAKGRGISLRQDIEQRLTSAANISEVEWLETEHPQHAVQLAQSAAEKGVSCAVAAGGDGTVSEVVNGLMRSTITPLPLLGVLPWGTC